MTEYEPTPPRIGAGSSDVSWRRWNEPPLRGRTVAIRGATRGIGSMVAELLASDGADIVLAARGGAELESRAAQISGRSPDVQVVPVSCDVTDEREARHLMHTAVKSTGRIDALINAAGVTGPIETPLEEVTATSFREVLDINVTGTFLCCREAAPHLSRSPAGGRIVNLSSTAGLRGYANRAAYSASKWAIRGLTRALARELGPRGVTVNSVSPYAVHGTRMADVVEGKARRHGVQPQQVYEDFARQTALGRWIDEIDVAEAIRFLVSDAAHNISGQDIAIDAGWNA